MNWVADVVVLLKPVVNDPQGLTVRDALHRLGYAGVSEVRVGKHIKIELDASDERSAREMVEEMSERLLRNPVIEDFRISSIEAQSAPA